MTGNQQSQFIARAPGNGAPSRYAAVLDPKVGGPDIGGSTPLPTALRRKPAIPLQADGSVTPKSKSVTHVLNQKCYLCFDQTNNARCSMLNAQ